MTFSFILFVCINFVSGEGGCYNYLFDADASRISGKIIYAPMQHNRTVTCYRTMQQYFSLLYVDGASTKIEIYVKTAGQIVYTLVGVVLNGPLTYVRNSETFLSVSSV